MANFRVWSTFDSVFGSFLGNTATFGTSMGATTNPSEDGTLTAGEITTFSLDNIPGFDMDPYEMHSLLLSNGGQAIWMAGNSGGLLVPLDTIAFDTFQAGGAFNVIGHSSLSSVSYSSFATAGTPVNVAPGVDLDGPGGDLNFEATFTENGSVLIADSDAIISDGDDTTLDSLTVTISNFQAGDMLSAAGSGGILAGDISYNGAGVLTINPAAAVSLADFQAVLRSVAYSSTSDSPSTVARTIRVVVNDGETNSSTATSTITVQSVNDAPSITAPASFAVDEDGSVALSSISFSDLDSGSSPVAVTLTVTGGALSATSGGGVTVTGIAQSIFLTGTLSDINAFMAGSGATWAPSGNSEADQTLSVSINDLGNTGSGGALGATSTVTLDVLPQNDVPSATNLTQALAGTEDGGLIALSDIIIVDPDSTDIVTATLSLRDPLVGNLTTGTFGSVTSTFDALTGLWSVTGSTTDVNAALAAVAFSPAPDFHGNAIIDSSVVDAALASAGSGVITIAVLPVDDLSTPANDAFALSEAGIILGNLFADNGFGVDIDIDGAISIASVNGAAFNVGTSFALASGALVMVQSDGGLVYDPHGTFDHLPEGWTASDSFTYSLQDGQTATATFTITGVDSDDTFLGDAGDNSFEGGIGNDRLLGLEGDDILNGGIGRDIIRGGSGADSMDGGDGFDWLDYLGSRSGVSVDLEAGTGSAGDAAGDSFVNFEIVRGSSFDDTITGSLGNDRVRSGLGADLVDGSGGLDWIDYGGSQEAVTVYLALGVGFGGEAAGDILIDIERVIGSKFDDTLIGSLDNDLLRGGDGDDRLEGLGGADVLRGEGGADTFVFGEGFLTDRIADLSALEGDRIEVLDTLVGSQTLGDIYDAGIVSGSTLRLDFSGNTLVIDSLIDRDSFLQMSSLYSDAIL